MTTGADRSLDNAAPNVAPLLALHTAELAADLQAVGTWLRQSDGLLAKNFGAGLASAKIPAAAVIEQSGVLQALQTSDRVMQVIDHAVHRLLLLESILRLPGVAEHFTADIVLPAAAGEGGADALHSLLAQLAVESSRGPARHDGLQGGSVDLFD